MTKSLMPGYWRGNTYVRLFSDTEDDFITDLRIAGMSTAAIAKAVLSDLKIRRSAATISMRLKILAAKEEA